MQQKMMFNLVYTEYGSYTVTYMGFKLPTKLKEARNIVTIRACDNLILI